MSDIDALLGEIERLQSDLAAAIEREDALAAAIQTALDSPAMMGCHDIEVLGNAADCWRKAKAIQGPEL